MCKVDMEVPSSTSKDKEEDASPTPVDDQVDEVSPEPVVENTDDMEEPTPDSQEPQDDVNNNNQSTTKEGAEPYYRTEPAEYETFLERHSVRVARNPCWHFWVSLLVSLGLGVVGLVLGDFSVAVDNDGWYSRGTLIADREQQYWLIDTYRPALFADTTGEVWDNLESQTQKRVSSDDDDDRRLEEMFPTPNDVPTFSFWNDYESLGSRWQDGMQFLQGKRRISRRETSTTSQDKAKAPKSVTRKPPNAAVHDWVLRRLQTQDSLGPLEGCNVNWYNSSEMFEESRLWPVYKNIMPQTASLWDGPALQEMCQLEAVTQQYLEENNLCLTCDTNQQGDGGENTRCLLPYSPVLFARLTVESGLTMSCEQLAQAWDASYLADIEREMGSCVQAILSDYNPDQDGTQLPPNACPTYFFPHMMDENYPAQRDYISHSSAIYATLESAIDEMYENVDKFGYGSQYMETYYDTQFEDLGVLETDKQVLVDMALAVGSAGITLLAMVIHTRSPFLALVGLLQIVLSFPLAYFVYVFIARLEFFPFLNFIGIFVLFALGADDVFVAVDKWKNARLARPKAPAQEIAAKAFPDAAGAMLLTTLTTAVAFFGTAVCPVAPILCFAVFVGLLVIVDYVLCCLLVFPALVVYDNRLQAEKRAGCCCHCGLRSCCCCFMKPHSISEDAANQEGDSDEDGGAPSPIHRILNHYYRFLHRFRWPLLLVCAGALVVSAVKAAQIELPVSADVRLFDESDNQFEAAYIQRQNLLFEVVERMAGSTTDVIWGVIPADTGNHNNPESWTKLKLDPSFEPSREAVQVSLLNFCEKLFATEFATPVRSDYKCPMEQLNEWLAEQAVASAPEDIYAENCSGATGLPIPQDSFDGCAYAWSQAYGVDDVLAREGKIVVLSMEFTSRVRYDSPQSELDSEWNLINDWMAANKGPDGGGNPYFTSEDFWWYDTNQVMLVTAYTGAGIAMGAAAAVILFSSRSFVLTLFATVSVGYVLTSVTALLVAAGWTLGFLESILFAILIGISCDFVIHFSHAYASLEGHTPRDERTRYALISMGPSILAAAVTTFAASMIMLGTVISFFEKFAIILFLTILQATLGSFVVFLVLVDCIGPADPTYVVDHMLARCFAACGKEYHIQAEEPTQHFTTKEFNSIDG